MTDQPERLDLRSHDTTEDKRQELLRLFPEIRTEGGKVDFAIRADGLPLHSVSTVAQHGEISDLIS